MPEDMNYLSLADQEIVGAMESVLKRMTGTPSGAALVVSGCEVEFSTSNLQSLYKVNKGVILWNGLLWDLNGITVEGTVRTPTVYNTQLSILFDRTTVSKPSPVYGMGLQLDQNPHKIASASIVSTASVPKSAESIVLGMLMRLPVVGLSQGVNDLVLNGAVSGNE